MLQKNSKNFLTCCKKFFEFLDWHPSTERPLQIFLCQFVFGIAENLFCVACLDDFAQIDENHVIGYAHCLTQRVSDHNY